MTDHDASYSLAWPERDALRREWLLARQISEALGGCVPADYVELANVHRALHVGWGVGRWALELAYTAPWIQVSSIESSQQSLAFVQHAAQKAGLPNVSFLLHDPRSLETVGEQFAPQSFDLLHLAFLAPALLTIDYGTLLQRLVPLCRPGASILWSEMEFPITNSPAFERLMALRCRALQVAGHTFLPASMQEIAGLYEQYYQQAGFPTRPYERRHLGITPMMGRWLREAGYQSLASIPTAIEVSAGTKAHPVFVRQVEVFGQQIRPFLLEQGVIGEDALRHLCFQVLEEVQQDRFCGLCFVLTVLGCKPLSVITAQT